ncbi:MAG: Ig-like domain-containing protein, partial [Bacteroidetes bacterium]|nr:Ig-like domain-containing protein [Bacteroidota bacterium]
MNPDGTFRYEPEPGYVGPDSFEYTVNLVPLQELVFDPAENRLNVDATVSLILGTDSDNQDVAINGTVWADIGPTGNPIDAIQIVDLDIRNDADLNLKLDFGSPITLGSLRIDVT